MCAFGSNCYKLHIDHKPKNQNAPTYQKNPRNDPAYQKKAKIVSNGHPKNVEREPTNQKKPAWPETNVEIDPAFWDLFVMEEKPEKSSTVPQKKEVSERPDPINTYRQKSFFCFLAFLLTSFVFLLHSLL